MKDTAVLLFSVTPVSDTDTGAVPSTEASYLSTTNTNKVSTTNVNTSHSIEKYPEGNNI
jgi:hypothetical protein